MGKITVLLVCMGNICRSPTAEGVLAHLVKQRGLEKRFVIDSAGTHAFHIGSAPDMRSQKAARDRGVELKHLRARQVTEADFDKFDYILVMDNDNYHNLREVCPPEQWHKVQLFLDYAPDAGHREVPDPYYGGSYGFERVLDLVESASEGFLNALEQQGKLV